MSTTLYLPSSGTAAPISPAIDGWWNGSAAGFKRLSCSTTKTGTAITTISSAIPLSQDYVFSTYCTPPLNGAQTISGTVSLGINPLSTTYTNTLQSEMIIKVFSSAGVLRGTILAHTQAPNFATSGSPISDFINAALLTSLACSNGDYIVIELGINCQNGADTGNLYFGDNSANNLPTSSQLSQPSYNPVVVFSQTISFGVAGPPGSLFYLPSTSLAVPITPPIFSGIFDGGQCSSFKRLRASLTKMNTSQVNFGDTNSEGSSHSYIAAQYISPPLNGAQTISGSVSAALYAFTNSHSSTFTFKLGIQVIASDGVTVRGTPAGPGATSAWSGGPTYTSQYINGSALSSVSALDGDYLTMELGWYTSLAGVNGQYVVLGDNQATNYPYTGTQNGSTSNPTIQFSNLFNFKEFSSNSNDLMMMGIGT